MISKSDLAEIDRLIKPPAPQERIYGWQNSQLSIARFAGGCRLNGVDYMIDYGAEGEPLVLASVLAAEARAKKLALKADRDAQKKAASDAQGVIAINDEREALI